MKSKNIENDVVVGAIYELPDKRFVRTFGWDGHVKDPIVSYYFDNGKGGLTCPYSETKSWKLRNDLKDFPNARDPRLPYEFDLHWDIKYRSDLVKALLDHPEAQRIKDCMGRYKKEMQAIGL